MHVFLGEKTANFYFRYLGHPNIIKVYGVSFNKDTTGKHLQVFLELCDENMEYVSFIKQSPTPCGRYRKLEDCVESWKFYRDAMKSVCSAVEYIHERDLIHGSLTLRNILVRISFYPAVTTNTDPIKGVNTNSDIVLLS